MPNSGVLIGESDETGIGIEQLSAEEFRGIADYVHGKIVGACQNMLVEPAVTLLELKEAALHMNNTSEGGKAW